MFRFFFYFIVWIVQSLHLSTNIDISSVLWHCWSGGRKGMIRPVKNWVVGCWCGYMTGQGADLHTAQLIPLLLNVSCSRKSRLVLVFPFWYRLTRVVPEKIQRAVKWLLLCCCTWHDVFLPFWGHVDIVPHFGVKSPKNIFGAQILNSHIQAYLVKC